MKKYFTFGLIMSLVSGACFAEHPMITQLIREKQQKMEKLEKCKGTTKNLKIAGISTLGITAVGVGANIAEAVVLSNTKDDVKKAKVARDAQLEIKGNRQEFEQFCNEIGGDLVYSGSGCVKYAADIDEYNGLVSMMRQKFSNCQATANPLQERCVDKDKRGVSIILREQNDQNKGSGQGNKEQNSGQAGNGNQQGNGQGVAQNSAGTKQEQTPAEKTEEIAAKKSDEEFMNACKNMGYRLSAKNSGELSCFYEVKTPTKKADMKSMASNQVRGTIGALCAGNTLRDGGNYYAIYCGKGTVDHRLYITFKSIAEETPGATTEENAGDADNGTVTETPGATTEENAGDADNGTVTEAPGATTEENAGDTAFLEECKSLGCSMDDDGECNCEGFISVKNPLDFNAIENAIKEEKDRIEAKGYECELVYVTEICYYKCSKDEHKILSKHAEAECLNGKWNSDKKQCDCKENYYINGSEGCIECPKNQYADEGDNVCKDIEVSEHEYVPNHKRILVPGVHELNVFKDYQYATVDKGIDVAKIFLKNRLKGKYDFDCKAEDGTPRLYGQDYILCKHGSTTFRFEFDDLND